MSRTHVEKAAANGGIASRQGVTQSQHIFGRILTIAVQQNDAIGTHFQSPVVAGLLGGAIAPIFRVTDELYGVGLDGDFRPIIDNNNTLTGTARSVPFAREADSFAVVARRGDEVVIALVDAASCQIANGLSLADDAKDEVTLDGVVASEVGRAPDEFNEDALFMMGALARSCEMAGALEAMLEISVTYSQDRVAFERPISKFQAVQHNLARLAGEAAAAVCAAGSAADALQRSGSFDEDVFFEIASAKIRVGEAAGEGAGIAHQVHGAIGFTMEHILHRYSRRVWSWRDEFGSESIWAVRLGEAVAAKGSDALWATLASR